MIPMLVIKMYLSEELDLTNEAARNEAPGGGGMTGRISEPGGPNDCWFEGKNGLVRPRAAATAALSWLDRNLESRSRRSQSDWGEDSGSCSDEPPDWNKIGTLYYKLLRTYGSFSWNSYYLLNVVRAEIATIYLMW